MSIQARTHPAVGDAVRDGRADPRRLGFVGVDRSGELLEPGFMDLPGRVEERAVVAPGQARLLARIVRDEVLDEGHARAPELAGDEDLRVGRRTVDQGEDVSDRRPDILDVGGIAPDVVVDRLDDGQCRRRHVRERGSGLGGQGSARAPPTAVFEA